jgi:ankyrin repeat protein
MRSGLLILAGLLPSRSPCLSAEVHDAARQGDIQAVAKLLDQGVAPDAKDETGETALLPTSLAGHADVVATLVKRGAGTGSRNDRGLTHLHGAAYDGSLESLQLLVDSGAAVNDSDNVSRRKIRARRDRRWGAGLVVIVVASETRGVEAIRMLVQAA